jgi:hypothetical protein
MSAASRRLTPTAALRAAAWRLEKTNPLWRVAKQNKGSVQPAPQAGSLHGGNLAEGAQLQLKLPKYVSTAGFRKRNLHERWLATALTPEDENGSGGRPVPGSSKKRTQHGQNAKKTNAFPLREHLVSVRRQSIFGRTRRASKTKKRTQPARQRAAPHAAVKSPEMRRPRRLTERTQQAVLQGVSEAGLLYPYSRLPRVKPTYVAPHCQTNLSEIGIYRIWNLNLQKTKSLHVLSIAGKP